MRSYASAYKMCVATFPKPSQPDGSIAPAHALAGHRISWHGRRYRVLPERGGEQLQQFAFVSWPYILFLMGKMDFC